MKNDLTVGHPLKVLIKFALPLLIGNAFQQLYNIVDSMVVGNYVGYEALAAVGQAFPILLVFVSLIIGFSSASNILIAQYYGAKDNERAQLVVDSNIIANIFFSIVVMIIGYIITPVILTLVQTPIEVFEHAQTYLRIIFLIMPLTFGYNGLAAIFRGFGDSKTSLFALMVSTVVNIALDLLFVIVFGWGVAGVGIATGISQLIAILYLIFVISRKKSTFNVKLTKLKFNSNMIGKIFKIGLPMGGQQALVGLALTTMVGLVNTFGSTAMAGFAAASKVDGFAFLPIMSIGIALTTYTAQNVGAGKLDRVKTGLLWGNILSVSMMVVFGALLMIFSEPVLSLFISNNIDVINVGKNYFYIVMPGYLFQAIVFTHMGVVRGYGETIAPMVVAIMNLWVFRLPFAFLLSSIYPKVTSLWWAMDIGFVIGMIVMVTYYHKGNYKNKKVM